MSFKCSRVQNVNRGAGTFVTHDVLKTASHTLLFSLSKPRLVTVSTGRTSATSKKAHSKRKIGKEFSCKEVKSHYKFWHRSILTIMFAYDLSTVAC